MQPLKVSVVSESAFTVQGHGVHTAFVENIEALRRRPDVRVQANRVQGSDIIHIHTVGLFSLGVMLFAKGGKVVTAHVTPDSFVGSLIGAKYWYGLAKIYLRWFYNLADAVLAVSQEVVDQLQTMGVKKPIHIMHNTIDTSAYRHTPEQKAEVRQKLGIPQDAFVVVSVGQVQPRKRIDVFVDCAKALPEARFIWVGGVPFKKFAANYGEMQSVMNNPPANLSFTGVIPLDEVRPYYWAADLFFLPSDQETFGIVIVEAAASGLPVLLRDLPQYSDTFKTGYESGDDSSFAKIITRFASDQDFYRQACERSAQIAAAFDSVAGTERLMAIYRQLATKNGSV